MLNAMIDFIVLVIWESIEQLVPKGVRIGCYSIAALILGGVLLAANWQ